jgi:ABC-2 type transport system ATP-binding protein
MRERWKPRDQRGRNGGAMTAIDAQVTEAMGPRTDAPVPAREVAIMARGLSKRFDDNAVLRDLALEVQAGEIFGLIGPSGSGKSTAIHLLCGHLRPSGGEVSVLSHEPARFTPAIRRRIGYMPQGFVLYPDLSVEQNVAFVAGLYGFSEWRSRPRIRATLELVQLWETRKRAAREVSGGMQRRIALAAALVHDPEVLFLDEPTANLDPILRAHLWEHFRALRERGRAILVTTQYVDEAEYCDRVGLMYDGALIATGQPLTLRRQAFGGDVVEISIERPATGYLDTLGRVQGVRSTEERGEAPLRVTVEDAQHAIPALLDALETSGATVRSVAQYQPTFDEVFIRLIQQHGDPLPATGRLVTSG